MGFDKGVHQNAGWRGGVDFEMALACMNPLNGAVKTLLSPSFVQNDGDRVGEVQASLSIDHFQAQQVRVIKLLSDVLGQTARFLSKEEPVAILKAALMDIGAASGAQSEQTRSIRVLRVQEGVPIGVLLYLSVLMVIKPSSSHQLVLHGKTQGFNEVQLGACVGGQANDIARVGRNLRLVEDNLKHMTQ